VVAEQVVEVAETPNNDHQQDGSNGMAFRLGAYSNKRRAVARQGPRQNCMVQSGPRKISATFNPKSTNKQNEKTTPDKIAKSEINNHTDMTCFGSNFTAIHFTGAYCEVQPFSDQYNTMPNIPIATAATARDNPDTGEVVILLFHQGLWFGDALENSLINLNQWRMHGIEICDDPFDSNRKIWIKDPVNEIEIPMEFGNNFVYLTTQAPSLEEIRNIPPIEMTSDAPWDPLKVGQRQLLWEEEERQALISSISINEYTTSHTRLEEPQLHMDECEYDILLSSCSPVYSERTLMQRLIASVKVARCYNNEAAEEGKTNKKDVNVLAVDTRARHTELLAEEVSRKFGVGLETARKTLKATTQYRIRHAVHPLSRRYRTDII
jgi:hypothetical protein